jgi:hypothetical protein
VNGPKEFTPPAPEAVAHVRKLAERRLSAEELNAYVNAPMSQAELEGIWESIDWFCRRYPTVLDRLAYARRAYKRWQKACPPMDLPVTPGPWASPASPP